MARERDGAPCYSVIAYECSSQQRRFWSPSGVRPVTRAREDRVGRNDPCTCGSGQKYKHCHGFSGRLDV